MLNEESQENKKAKTKTKNNNKKKDWVDKWLEFFEFYKNY